MRTELSVVFCFIDWYLLLFSLQHSRYILYCAGKRGSYFRLVFVVDSRKFDVPIYVGKYEGEKIDVFTS